MLHGINGIVLCVDTLLLTKESFRGAFRVNRKLSMTGIPEIEYINDSDYALGFLRINSEKPIEKQLKKIEQLSLFPDA